jgi:prophage regulatory protein
MKAAEQKRAVEERLVSIKEVVRLTSLSRASIVRHEAAGLFPRHRQISPKRIAFLLSEVMAWLENCPVAGEKEKEVAA